MRAGTIHSSFRAAAAAATGGVSFCARHVLRRRVVIRALTNSVPRHAPHVLRHKHQPGERTTTSTAPH